MRISKTQLLLFAIAALLAPGAGCERSYGVMRSARLPKFPDPACVRAAIGDVAGIRNYNEWHSPQEEGKRAREVDRSHNFAYNGDHVTVELGLFDDGHGPIRFVQSYLFNKPPPQREIDEARHLMIAVEEGLMARCGLSELREGVREYCSGVQCR